MKERIKYEQSILKIMKDFIYYGYNFKNFLEHDYPICKDFTEKQLKQMWKDTREKLSYDF